MKMEKSPAELVSRFEASAPTSADIVHRNMFGYPACFVNGNMFTGLFGSRLFVRLGKAQRAEVLAQPGFSLLEPMPGRPMKEYVVLPDDVVADSDKLALWVVTAAEHARTLPPKEPKAKKTRNKQ